MLFKNQVKMKVTVNYVWPTNYFIVFIVASLSIISTFFSAAKEIILFVIHTHRKINVLNVVTCYLFLVFRYFLFVYAVVSIIIKCHKNETIPLKLQENSF